MRRTNYLCLIFFIFMGNALLPASLPVSPETGSVQEYRIIQARIGNKNYLLDIADNFWKRNRGLSRRKSLPKNRGMLFVFSQPGIYEFCMAEMNFPLDFIWLKDNRVIALRQNVPPTSKTQLEIEDSEVITISKSFNKVIELNAGEIGKSGIDVGNKISFY